MFELQTRPVFTSLYSFAARQQEKKEGAALSTVVLGFGSENKTKFPTRSPQIANLSFLQEAFFCGVWFKM